MKTLNISGFFTEHFYKLFLVLLLGVLSACSTEDDQPVGPPDATDPYLTGVTREIVLDKESFLERLSLEANNPIAKLLPEKSITISSVLYRTETPDNERVEASGIITYPSDGLLKGVVVCEHYTIGADKEAPSSMMATIESALALFGYLVITPDYLGFGSTRDLPQTYLHAETAGRISVDMVFAIREYMDSLGINIEQEPLTVVGYSQGAFSALAFTRMVEAEYADKISIKQVFAGGGPYMPRSMFDLFVEQDQVANPATVVLTILGLDYAEGLNLNYSNVFQEPLLSNYKEWCISKNYTLGQINRQLGTDKLSGLMHPDFFEPSMNKDLSKIIGALDKNDLTSWKPRAPIRLVHGTKDRTVPYINAESALASFSQAGSDVTLVPVNSDHSETAIPFYIIVLGQLTGK